MLSGPQRLHLPHGKRLWRPLAMPREPTSRASIHRETHPESVNLQV